MRDDNRWLEQEIKDLTQAVVGRRDLFRAGIRGGSAFMLATLLHNASRLGAGPAEATTTQAGKLTGPLNVLAWEGYDDPAIVDSFEKKYNVKLNIKVATGNNGQLDQIRAHAIQFDVANPDTTWPQIFAKAGLIEPLNRGDFPHLDEMFTPFQHYEPQYYQGQLYGVPTRWGINGLIHWPDKISPAEAADANILWDSKLRNRVTIRDWYDLYILLTGLYYLGDRKAWELEGADLEKVTKRLIQFKPNLRSVHVDGGGVKTDLANRDVWLVWGASSNDVAVTLRLSGKNVTLTIPKQGGAVWAEALVIVKGTQHLETAKAYINHMTSPEVQTMMLLSKTKHNLVCNARIKNSLTAEQSKNFDLDKVDMWVSQSIGSNAPVHNDEWLKAWEMFKSA